MRAWIAVAAVATAGFVIAELSGGVSIGLRVALLVIGVLAFVVSALQDRAGRGR
jgi:hypothetical protein